MGVTVAFVVHSSPTSSRAGCRSLSGDREGDPPACRGRPGELYLAYTPTLAGGRYGVVGSPHIHTPGKRRGGAVTPPPHVSFNVVRWLARQIFAQGSCAGFALARRAAGAGSARR